MGKVSFRVIITMLFIIGFVLTGCNNITTRNEESGKSKEVTRIEQAQIEQTQPQNEESQTEETNPETIAVEPSQVGKISVRYWLGDVGEKTIEYSLKTIRGQKDLISDKGETILAGFEEYDLMLNLILAKKDGKWGLYDKTGQKIIEHMYEEIANHEMPDGNKANGLVGVKKNGLWGAVDQEGNIIIRPEFEYVELNYYEEVEPFIKVKKNGKFGYLTRDGQPLVDTIWDTAFMDVLNVPEAIIFVKQGQKWGGIRVEDSKAKPVDWKLIPSEEAQLSFNNWKYDYQYDFYRHQIQDGVTSITIATKIFFHDYFRKNTQGICSLPEFSQGNRFYIYELTDLAKGKREDGKESWKIRIAGYYFHELDGNPDETSPKSKNAQVIWNKMKEEAEYKGLSFLQACDRLAWNNPGDVLEPDCEWLLEFTVNDPLGDIYFNYLSCKKTGFQDN